MTWQEQGGRSYSKRERAMIARLEGQSRSMHEEMWRIYEHLGVDMGSEIGYWLERLADETYYLLHGDRHNIGEQSIRTIDTPLRVYFPRDVYEASARMTPSHVDLHLFTSRAYVQEGDDISRDPDEPSVQLRTLYTWIGDQNGVPEELIRNLGSIRDTFEHSFPAQLWESLFRIGEIDREETEMRFRNQADTINALRTESMSIQIETVYQQGRMLYPRDHAAFRVAQRFDGLYDLELLGPRGGLEASVVGVDLYGHGKNQWSLRNFSRAVNSALDVYGPNY